MPCQEALKRYIVLPKKTNWPIFAICKNTELMCKFFKACSYALYDCSPRELLVLSNRTIKPFISIKGLEISF